MADHSPLPWRVFIPKPETTHIQAYVVDAGGLQNVLFRATIGLPEAERDLPAANAEFIVRAVNSHDALVAAARLAVLHFRRNHASKAFQGDDEHEAWTALQAALAKAEGQ